MRRALLGILSVVLAASTPRAARAEDAGAGVVAPPTRDTSTPVPAEPQFVTTGCMGCGATTAKELPPADGGPQRRGSRWYGWQTLTTDAAATTLLFAGVEAGNSPLIGTGILTFGVGAPIVHLVHGRAGAAAGSLAARVAMPILGLAVGYASEKCGSPGSEDNSGCGIGGAAIGSFIGAGIASIFDAAVLSHEKVDPEPQRSTPVSLSPTVGVSKHAGTVGVAGAF